jgi:hypothetical protein
MYASSRRSVSTISQPDWYMYYTDAQKPTRERPTSEHDQKLLLKPVLSPPPGLEPPEWTTQGQGRGDIMRELPPSPLGTAPSPPSKKDEFKEDLLEKIFDKVKNKQQDKKQKKVVVGFRSVCASSLIQLFNDQFEGKEYVESEGYRIQVRYPKQGGVASITIKFKNSISDINDLSCINDLIQALANTTFIAQRVQPCCVICSNIRNISSGKGAHFLEFPFTRIHYEKVD